jgi:hypothetical protein
MKWFQAVDASALRDRIGCILTDVFNKANLENGKPESISNLENGKPESASNLENGKSELISSEEDEPFEGKVRLISIT